jgi:hypothetical protein
MAGFLVLVVIVLFIGIINLLSQSNNKGREEEKAIEIECKKNQLYRASEESLIKFIRTHPEEVGKYFKFVSTKGDDRSYKTVYETYKYRIEKSFDDNDFEIRIVLIRKSDDKCVLYLVV